MNGINKLRAMQRWFDMHDEHFNDQFNTVKQLEQLFDYSIKNNLDFMDEVYLFSNEIMAIERKKALKFINKIK